MKCNHLTNFKRGRVWVQTDSIFNQQEEQEAAAQVYQEFVASFDDAGKNINKAWVKGGTVNPSDKDKKGE